MPIRVMFDSDVIADLPRNALCATYADLVTTHPQLDNLRAEFPYGLLFIDRHGDPLDIADILDVERGLHSVSDAPGWLRKRHTQGKTGRLYCDRSTLPALDQAVQGLQHFRWVTTLDGTSHIAGFQSPHTPAAIQNLSAAMLGFHCDGSLVFQDAFAPVPPVWEGSGSLLNYLHSMVDDMDHIRTIVKRHTSLANLASIPASIEAPPNGA